MLRGVDAIWGSALGADSRTSAAASSHLWNCGVG